MAQPVIEGGTGTRSFSTDEGAKLTEKKDPQFKVRLPLLSEIFTKAHKGKVKKDKVKILKEENCRALQQICQWAYNPTIKSMLPEGTPPYVENDAPEGTEHMLLRTEGDKLWHFVSTGDKPANPTLQSTQRERMFIRLLEGLHKDEAELLINVKDKRLHQVYKGVSSDVVKEAFDWTEDFKVKGV
tara:strand:- start:41 stop:595 length:555 start_codon:yes stop_codon:yes gene_type:complete